MRPLFGDRNKIRNTLLFGYWIAFLGLICVVYGLFLEYVPIISIIGLAMFSIGGAVAASVTHIVGGNYRAAMDAKKGSEVTIKV